MVVAVRRIRRSAIRGAPTHGVGGRIRQACRLFRILTCSEGARILLSFNTISPSLCLLLLFSSSVSSSRRTTLLDSLAMLEIGVVEIMIFPHFSAQTAICQSDKVRTFFFFLFYLFPRTRLKRARGACTIQVG